jgi:hypothetical protein
MMGKGPENGSRCLFAVLLTKQSHFPVLNVKALASCTNRSAAEGKRKLSKNRNCFSSIFQSARFDMLLKITSSVYHAQQSQTKHNGKFRQPQTTTTPKKKQLRFL